MEERQTKKLFNQLLDTIKCKKTKKCKSDLTSGNKYYITLTKDKKQVRFYFNDNYKNRSTKKDFIMSLYIDASYYVYAKEYENILQEEKESCKKQYLKLHKLFNEAEIQIIEDMYHYY